MKNITFFLISLVIFLYLSTCGERTKVLNPQDQETKIRIDLTGFGTLGTAAQYNMWAVYDSANVEVMKYLCDFIVDDQGTLSQTVFNINLGIIQKATTLVISIEQADSIPAEASVYRIIAAKLVANSGEFSVGDDYLLKFDLGQALASYQILKTVGSEAVRGIWFMTGDTTKEAGIVLPDAPSRWKYESFAIVSGDTLSMGTFGSPGKPDSHNDYGNGLPIYPFPGENFLKDPSTGNDLNVDLRGEEIFIKITPPYPSYAQEPFELVIFKGTIPTDAIENTTYQLNNNSDTFPGGTIKVIIKIFE
jgi:hypothetical protein